MRPSDELWGRDYIIAKQEELELKHVEGMTSLIGLLAAILPETPQAPTVIATSP